MGKAAGWPPSSKATSCKALSLSSGLGSRSPKQTWSHMPGTCRQLVKDKRWSASTSSTNKCRIARIMVVLASEAEVHVSPFRVIPKKSNLNKWCLIVNLSSPKDHRIYDAISLELSFLNYVTVNKVVSHNMQLGRGAVMTKIDVKQAYKNIPVHPADSLVLGMRWADKTYVDRTLLFGLRSAPLIFLAVEDGIQWMMEQKRVMWVKHYVNDFITVGATH